MRKSNISFFPTEKYNANEFLSNVEFVDFDDLYKKLKDKNPKHAKGWKSIREKFDEGECAAYESCTLAIIVNGEKSVYARNANPCYPEDLVAVVNITLPLSDDDDSCIIV